jgi:hypothetical protein
MQASKLCVRVRRRRSKNSSSPSTSADAVPKLLLRSAAVRRARRWESSCPPTSANPAGRMPGRGRSPRRVDTARSAPRLPVPTGPGWRRTRRCGSAGTTRCAAGAAGRRPHGCEAGIRPRRTTDGLLPRKNVERSRYRITYFQAGRRTNRVARETYRTSVLCKRQRQYRYRAAPEIGDIGLVAIGTDDDVALTCGHVDRFQDGVVGGT